MFTRNALIQRLRALAQSSLALFVSVVCISMAARSEAAIITGSFSGLAYNSRIQVSGPIMGNFDGQRVNGTFYFDPSDQGQFIDPFASGDYYAAYLTRPGSLRLSFSAAGQQATFVDDFTNILLYKSPDTQYVTLSYGSHPLYNGQLTLYGDLFQDLWHPETFHAGPLNLNESYASFDDGRYFGAGVRLTSVTFDTTSVPEPSTLLLLLIAAPFVVRRKAQGGKKEQLPPHTLRTAW